MEKRESLGEPRVFSGEEVDRGGGLKKRVKDSDGARIQPFRKGIPGNSSFSGTPNEETLGSPRPRPLLLLLLLVVPDKKVKITKAPR